MATETRILICCIEKRGSRGGTRAKGGVGVRVIVSLVFLSAFCWAESDVVYPGQPLGEAGPCQARLVDGEAR